MIHAILGPTAGTVILPSKPEYHPNLKIKDNIISKTKK